MVHLRSVLFLLKSIRSVLFLLACGRTGIGHVIQYLIYSRKVEEFL